MNPTMAHGKICYIVIPARDIAEAAAFYEAVFGWHIRRRDDGTVAFDDSVGQVSGTFVTGLPPSTTQGVFIHIMVASVDDTMAAIFVHDGTVLEGPGRHLPEITARFSDPSGNVFGMYQEPSLRAR
jgi:predicted enzyme related to lactoylglutathione lyase